MRRLDPARSGGGSGVARRDEEFARFVSVRRSWLRRIAYLLCQERGGAEELTDAALMEVYLDWPKASRAADLDAHARAVLVRTYLGRGTPRRLFPGRTAGPRRESHRESRPGPGTTSDVIAALDVLEPRQRAVVVLRFYCDLPVPEIAEVLAMSQRVIDGLSARGLQSLQEFLAGLATREGHREDHHDVH